MLRMVANDLLDTDMIETGTGLSQKQLAVFIKRHYDAIVASIDAMYADALEKNDLKALLKPELGWFREFMEDDLVDLIDRARMTPTLYD
jgi:hypothetical protein